MKNKINRFYADNFDDKRLELIIPKSKIFFYVKVGGKYSGSFSVKSKDSRKIRGMIYTSTFRMQCKESGFDDVQARISYMFDAAGLPAGEMVKGKFDVVTEAGEYEIPFTAVVEIPFIETSMGRVSNVDDFARLAAYNYREAANLFESTRFRELLDREDDNVTDLYEGMRKLNLTERSMEEFLIATGHKERLKLALGAGEKYYQVPERSITDVLEVGKNTWGYVPIQVTCGGEFLALDRDRFSTLEFDGNRLLIDYTILRERLHEGLNFDHIDVITPYETYTYRVTVDNSRVTRQYLDERRERQLREVALLKYYIGYRLGELDLEEWAHDSRQALSEIRYSDDVRPEYLFLKAYICLEEGDREGAAKILGQFANKRWSKAKEADAWACYAYLICRIQQDLSLTMRTIEEIRRLHERDNRNWLLLWTLLQMEEYLIQNSERRLQVIEEQWETGRFHSLLYLEAYLTIREQPGLIDLNHPFIIRVLLFAKRRGILSKEVAASVALSVSRHREYSRLIYEILEGCYEIRPTRDILSAICRYLIMCHCSDRKYFYWYELGVRDELHIARLYEFFMYSINEDSQERLPQAIYLYFSHQNELNAAKKAFMYANLVRYMEQYPDIYDNVRDQMEHFTRTQLRSGKITPNLRVLYRHFLPTWDLDDETVMSLANILFTYELRIKDPKIKQVIVLYKNMNGISTVPVLGGKAQVRLFTKMDQVILKDGAGNLYVNTIPYESVRMFPEDRFLDKMRADELPHTGLILNLCENGRITDQNRRSFEALSKHENLRESARKKIRRDLLFYYYDRQDKNRMHQYLADLDDSALDGDARSKLIRIYMYQNQLKKAFEIIRKYGILDIEDQCLVECCSKYVREDFYRENQVLINACYQCFLRDRYDDTMLGYLIENFCGRTADMKRIWKVAQQTEHNTHNLEERILIQMLFTEEVIGEEAIFYDYYIHGANDRVKTAYLSYKSYGYFVHNKILDERFFEYIETEYAREGRLNLSCKLAALKYYAGRKTEDKLIRKMIDEFLGDCRTEGLFFSYFQNYDEQLMQKYSLSNRTVLQYRGSERSKVTLYYRIHKAGQRVNSYDEEIMNQTYHTYFLKELLLFTGEIMDYYIVEESENASNIVEVGRISQHEEFADFTGRFNAINKILKAEYPEQLLDEYERKSYMVTQMFRVL